MSKKEKKNKANSEEVKDDVQLSIDDVKKIEDVEDKIENDIEINENSDADYIHDESIVSDSEFKKKLKEEKYKEKLRNKELYKQYKKDRKERKKANKEDLKKITDKQARREFKIEKREEELNIRSDLGVKTKGERFTIYLKRTVMRGSLQTFLLVLILVSAYITINLYTQNAKLPKIDVTANKVFTLSKESKEYIASIEDDVKLYAYGFPETYYICDFLKQYDKYSDHITFEIIDQNTSPELTQKYNLLNESQVVIVETATSSKRLYTSDFSSYDTQTGDEIDLMENSITNAIYSCLSKNQPKVYYLSGHSSFQTSLLNIYKSSNLVLTNNGFQIDEFDFMNSGKIPEDCDLIIIPHITTDLYDKEAEQIKNYIQKGGNIIVMAEYNASKTVSTFKNLKSILDIYDSMIVNNGFVFEQDDSLIIPQLGASFLKPTLNNESSITSSLFDSNSVSDRSNNAFVAFYFAGKLNLPSEESQSKNKLKVTVLASSSDSSILMTGEKQTVGSYPIAAMVTKTIKEGEKEEDTIKSSIILIADSNFCSDRTLPIQNTGDLTLSYLGKNIDLFTNSIAELTDKEDFMKLRKPVYTATFTPTNTENSVVRIIIIAFPLIIILIGIVVKTIRKRRN